MHVLGGASRRSTDAAPVRRRSEAPPARTYFVKPMCSRDSRRCALRHVSLVAAVQTTDVRVSSREPIELASPETIVRRYDASAAHVEDGRLTVGRGKELGPIPAVRASAKMASGVATSSFGFDIDRVPAGYHQGIDDAVNNQ